MMHDRIEVRWCTEEVMRMVHDRIEVPWRTEEVMRDGA